MPQKLTKLPAKPAVGVAPLLADVRELILAARGGIARAVNSGLTLLYWEIGSRIRRDILKEKRAEYGEEIVSALGTQLIEKFGRGFGVRNLFRMVRFAGVFPDVKIVSALRTQLGGDSLSSDHPFRRRTETRFLRRDVPHRKVEHAHVGEEDWRDAL